MHDELWIKIIRIHNEAKVLILKAEEIDRDFKDFLQPILEQRHALEHLVRAKCAELNAEEDGRYVEENLHKAFGHEYRSFFDTADWLSIRIREKYIQLLESYSSDCIQAVFPDYYTTTRPILETFNSNIARIRADKDVTKNDEEIFREVDKYRDLIQQLLDKFEEMSQAIPALNEFKKRKQKEEDRRKLWAALIALLAALLGSAITYWIVG